MSKTGWTLNLTGALVATAMTAAAPAPAQTPAIAPPAAASPPAMAAPQFLPGYLPKGATPNSLSLLPPAPLTGSATQARDTAAAKAAQVLKGGPRWVLASQDAELRFPAAAETYACALDAEISPVTTPHLFTLLRRSLTDAGLSTYPTKTRYRRARPFMVLGGDICTPTEADHLRVDGSYPSGHAALGWTWALILAEASPERQDALLARGRAFAQSRVVCNVHWQSDVEQGMVMGSAVFARLQDEPAFRADLEAARGEITAARAAGQHPSRDCAAESAAVAAGVGEQP